MSGLAKILLHNGVAVSGSDLNHSAATDALSALGARVSVPHAAHNIENPELVVYTAAIKEDNPELVAARQKGVRTIERAVLLGEMMAGYPKAIAVSGTHGKTSTTSMLAHILLAAELDPTITVGGDLDILGGNLRIGGDDYFLAEACEYCRSFLQFHPFLGIILNVEADHLDYFKDLDDITDAFGDFAALLPEDGALVYCADSPRAEVAASKTKANAVSFGLQNGDYTAKNITYNQKGCAGFDVTLRGQTLFGVQLAVAGEHSILNALAAIAASRALGIPDGAIIKGVESFVGAHRRFEYKGKCNGATVVDDYAHHPTEIAATLAAVEKMDIGKLYLVFQPHTYTRTKALFDEFVQVLSLADQLIMADIFAAREPDTGLVSSKDVADKVSGAHYFDSFEKIADYLRAEAKEGDLIITMGAGDVYKIGEMIVK
ncbi:MAG: UDP-N-acetylmuramate--L-alanine ligase [Ruminococcaceae bacterium]|nr:UDP-N-acetylmuramate--L-alanine ligase [Oscillospiraceae bacterium]